MVYIGGNLNKACANHSEACAGLPTQPAAAHHCSCAWDGPKLLCNACGFFAACSSLLGPFHCWFSALMRRRFKAHHNVILGP
jgi:hypothetical protein